jgi:hypothetical protein
VAAEPLLRTTTLTVCYPEFLGRQEILLPSVYCEKLSYQFPGYGKRGPIRIPSISFLLVYLG